jgi:hypothetical protein
VLLLTRLQARGLVLVDVVIETATTKHLSRAKRRAAIPGGYPVATKDADPERLRASIASAAAKAGRPPGAKGGGNTTKRLRLYLDREGDARQAARLEWFLATGHAWQSAAVFRERLAAASGWVDGVCCWRDSAGRRPE